MRHRSAVDRHSDSGGSPGAASREKTASSAAVAQPRRRSRNSRRQAKPAVSETAQFEAVTAAASARQDSKAEPAASRPADTHDDATSSTRAQSNTLFAPRRRSVSVRLRKLLAHSSHHEHAASALRSQANPSDPRKESSIHSRSRISRCLHTLWNWQVAFWSLLRVCFILTFLLAGAAVLILLMYIASTDSQENSMGVLDMLAHFGGSLTSRSYRNLFRRAVSAKPCACARQRYRVTTFSQMKPSSALTTALLSRPGDLSGVHVRQRESIQAVLDDLEQSCGVTVREIKGPVTSLDGLYAQMTKPFRDVARGNELANNRKADPATDRNRCVIWLAPLASVNTVAGGLKEVLDSNSVRGRMIVPQGGRGLFVLVADVQRSALKNLMPHRVVHMFNSIG